MKIINPVDGTLNSNTLSFDLEMDKNDLFMLVKGSKYTDIWNYLENISITEIHDKSGASAKYSYEFRNPNNDMCLIIVTNKKGIYDVTLSSFYKKINIVMIDNIETNAFYDLLDLFLKPDEKINIGTWSLNKLTIDKNAQTKISLKSTTENADLEGIQKLISSIGEEERELIFKIRFIK